MAQREAENNASAKFLWDKQRPLWYVMYFLEWSIARAYVCRFLTTTQKIKYSTMQPKQREKPV